MPPLFYSSTAWASEFEWSPNNLFPTIFNSPLGVIKRNCSSVHCANLNPTNQPSIAFTVDFLLPFNEFYSNSKAYKAVFITHT